jgi:hypothetical protein
LKEGAETLKEKVNEATESKPSDKPESPTPPLPAPGNP